MLEKLVKNKVVRKAVLPVVTLATLLGAGKASAGDAKFNVFGKAGYFVPEGDELSEVYGAGPSFSGGLGVSGYYGSLVFGVDYFRKVGDWVSSYEHGLFFREDSYSDSNVRIISPSVTFMLNLRGKDEEDVYAFIGGGVSAPNVQEEAFHTESSDGFFYGSGTSYSDKESRTGEGLHGVVGVKKPIGDGALSAEIKYDSSKIGEVDIGGYTFNVGLEINF